MIAEAQLDQLRAMSIPDKLAVMEVLWEELYRTQSEAPLTAWQEQILRERVAKVESGEETPIAWETAKARMLAWSE
jgi:putative addiction module component (TIGR02574 family)